MLGKEVATFNPKTDPDEDPDERFSIMGVHALDVACDGFWREIYRHEWHCTCKLEAAGIDITVMHTHLPDVMALHNLPPCSKELLTRKHCDLEKLFEHDDGQDTAAWFGLFGVFQP